jgi:hypothetical protein
MRDLTLRSSGTRPEAGEPFNFTLGVTDEPLKLSAFTL